MKKFRFSLETVLDYKQQVLATLQTEHGAILAQIRAQEQHIEELEAAYRHLAQEFNRRKLEGISILDAMKYEQYLRAMERQIQQAILRLEDLRRLEEALTNPRFAVFLGRRSCPPTQPLVLGIRNTNLYQALLEEEWLVPRWRRKALFRFTDTIRLRIVTDGREGRAIKKDVPLSFSPYKRVYGYRYVKERPGKILSNEEMPGSTEHDPMTELR